MEAATFGSYMVCEVRQHDSLWRLVFDDLMILKEDPSKIRDSVVTNAPQGLTSRPSSYQAHLVPLFLFLSLSRALGLVVGLEERPLPYLFRAPRALTSALVAI